MAARKRTTKKQWISSPVLSVILLTVLVVMGVYLGSKGLLPGFELSGNSPTPGPVLSEDTLQVYFLPVGKADSHLIISGEESMLIDGGTDATEEELVAYLRKMGITRLTYVVATHPHKDHIGGLDAVLGELGADMVYLSYSEHTTRAYEQFLLAIEENGAPAIVPKAGDTFTLGEALCTFYGPVRTDYSDLNDTSLVFKVTLGEVDFLFTGDIEEAAERDLVNTYGEQLQSEVLKSPHHGSNSSSGKNFLEAVSPRIVVIPCGAEEDGEGPAEKVLKRLRNINAQVYTTASGIILCTTDGNGLECTDLGNGL